MPMFGQIMTAMREQMSATLSRSDVLKPLAWLVGLLLLATFGMVATKAEMLIQYICLGLTVSSVLLYGAAYVFCLRHDRDALRSEKYSINKMAIEHGLLGDSETGLFDPTDDAQERTTKRAAQIEHKA